MHILAPIFYDDFKCSADKCTYTCCAGWNIFVDAETYRKYEILGIATLYNEYFETDKDGNIKIKLINGICPFLNKKGLCRLVIEYGEDILCKTCEMFPRECIIKSKILEYRLSNTCPEVLMCLNRIKPPLSFFQEEIDIDIDIENEARNDLLNEYRNSAIDLLQLQEFPLWARLCMVYMLSENRYEKEDETKDYIRQYISIGNLRNIYQSLVQMDNPLDYKIHAIFELFFNFGNAAPADLGYGRYIDPLFEHVNKVSVDTLIDSWEDFNYYFQYTSDFFENFCVNYMYVKGIDGERKNILNLRVWTLLVEMSLIRFALFLQWHKNDKKLKEDDIIEISCYYARVFEHVSLKEIQNTAANTGDGKWFSLGKLYILLR